jgi:nitrite reductase/ring-hydroxylating ferredoxin subunit
MDFVYVADISEIPVGTMKLVIIDDREVLIVNVQKEYYALSNKCPHAGGSLSEGKLDHNIITCLKHGAEIDVITGKIVVEDDDEEEKEIRLLNFKGKDERSYKTKIEDKGIFVGY